MRNITTPAKAVSFEDALRNLAAKLTGKPAASLPRTQEAVVQYIADNISSAKELTDALAKELAPSNIQVNAVACGAIDTEMNAFLSEADRIALTEEIPSGRFGRPEEVAELVLDLAQKHSYLTGQIIRLDGGWI